MLRSVGAVCACLLIFACSSDAPEGSANPVPFGSDAGGAGGSGGEGPNSAAGAAGVSGAPVLSPEAGQIVEELCGDAGCACSNGIDDDGDGTIDGMDTECTGPFDDDEGSFATGIPGDNQDPKWQDCFFDGNSGAGDDGCRYHTDCLTGDIAQSDPNCQVVEECLDFCAPRTPNGCDCFGCCEVSFDGETVNVFIGADCSLENIDDEDACPRCVQTDSCSNECGECELCPGRTVDDLPDSCRPETPMEPDAGEPPPPSYTCDGGETQCSTTSDCGTGSYCQFGCCLRYVR